MLAVRILLRTHHETWPKRFHRVGTNVFVQLQIEFENEKQAGEFSAEPFLPPLEACLREYRLKPPDGTWPCHHCGGTHPIGGPNPCHGDYR